MVRNKDKSLKEGGSTCAGMVGQYAPELGGQYGRNSHVITFYFAFKSIQG